MTGRGGALWRRGNLGCVSGSFGGVQRRPHGRHLFWCDGNISCEILVYKDGRYIYSESASDMAKETSSFQDLRKLTGTLPNAKREDSVYVLTDSRTLTYQDVLWKFLSSSTETVTDIPFVWLFFPDYCEND